MARQKIIPNVWFDHKAEEAAKFYVSIFKNSRIGYTTHYTKAGFDVHRMPAGTVMTVEFELTGYKFVALNGGPVFQINPSISFIVSCGKKGDVDYLWSRLAEGGKIMMELGDYPFSERYGWIQDKYGVSWQLMFNKDSSFERVITPTLMFVGGQYGKAQQAINFYTSVFHDAKVGDIMRYSAHELPDKADMIKHGAFRLEGESFAAMDSARVHEFGFNEAVSLIVECNSQNEIDYYWQGLTGGGGQEGVCGWLKDKFGVSWQVSPAILQKMLRDKNQNKVEAVTNAFLKMKKFDIKELEQAFKG
jgi:predicted 3-demethylubiquinone-9 3-methyltransferase (glyoxalase superfamily)